MFTDPDSQRPLSWVQDGTRIHSLDGLRAVSIAIVIASHFTRIGAIPSGFGVSVFFVISGFLITRLLLSEFDRTGTIDLVAFYRRRAFRLLPAILMGIALAILVQEVTGVDWVTPERIVASLFFFQNYYLNVHHFFGPLGVHWSLAVEEHFYFIFPIALLLLHKRIGIHFVPILLWTCLAILLMRGITIQTFDDPEAAKGVIRRSTHLRIDTILAGCILALMAHHQPTRILLKGVVSCHPIALGLAILIAGHTLSGSIELVVKFSTQALGITLVVAGILFSERCVLLRWALNLPPVVWIGRLSFSLYLLHMQANYLTAHFLPWGPHDWQTLPFAVALAILMSWACYSLVEQPMIRLGKRMKGRSWIRKQA